MAIDIGQAALILVDAQNDFCPACTGKDGKQRPEGALSRMEQADPAVIATREVPG